MPPAWLRFLLAAAALDAAGNLRRTADFNAGAALHFAGDGEAAVSSYLLGLGGRRIAMVRERPLCAPTATMRGLHRSTLHAAAPRCQ